MLRKTIVYEKHFQLFIGLTPDLRHALLESIEVLDGAPLIAELDALIEERIRMIAPRGKVTIARQQLEGWWWPRICTSLQADKTETISIIEVEEKLDDIRESLKRDALPLDMENVDLPEEKINVLKQMRFVRQLCTVGIDGPRLQYAMRDYYRAFTQRSQWTRLHLVFDGEIGQFEQMLIEEWEPRFHRMCEELAPNCGDVDLKRAGQDIYHWVESEARFPFRTVTRRFLNVGSYHMLANALRIGWHRDYEVLHKEDKSDGADES